MKQKNLEKNKNKNGQGLSRPTLGLITNTVDDPNHIDLWQGMIDVAEDHDVNLLCFAGRQLRSPHGFEAQGNLLYELINSQNVDGLAIWTSVLSHFVGQDNIRAFCEEFRPIPLISIGSSLPGIPSVLMHDDDGRRQIFAHLIETHGYRRIAFINCQEEHDRWERYLQLYTNVLADYGLPFDHDLVVAGNLAWSAGRKAGHAAIDLLLDERQIGFEAVVAVTDNMALGALQALQARGIQIPHQVAVAGFDNIDESGYVTPPLTTVSLGMYQRGRHAAEMLLAQLRDEPVQEQVILSPELILRQSCGCFSEAIKQAASEYPVSASVKEAAIGSSEAKLDIRNEQVVEEIRRAVLAALTDQTRTIDSAWIDRLLDALLNDLLETDSDTFLVTLSGGLQATIAAGSEVMAWQNILSVLRSQLFSYLKDTERLLKAENLWQQARVMIGETAQRVRAQRQIQIERQTQQLHEIGQRLITTFDIDQLMDIVAQALPRLGIRSCYIALYEDPKTLAGWSRLALAYNEHGRAELRDERGHFSSGLLVPSGLLPKNRRYRMIVEPLYVRDEPLGFALFEVDEQDEKICEALRGQISSALQGALLVQRVIEQGEERGQAEIALRESEQEYQQILDAITDMVLVKGPQSRILWANKAFRDYYGMSNEELQGIIDAPFNEPDYTQQYIKDDAYVFDNGKVLDIPEEPTTRYDGLVQRFHTVKSPIFNEAGEVVMTVGVSRNITERKQIEEIVARRATELETVAQVSTATATILDSDELLQQVVDLTKSSFSLYHAQVYLLNESGNALDLTAGAGAVGRKMVAEGWRIPLDRKDSLVAKAARQGQGVIVNDVRNELGFLPNPLLPDTRSEMVIPIVLGEHVLGALDVQADTVDRFTKEDIQVKTILAGQLAVALQNARQYQEAQRRVERERLVNAITQKIQGTISIESALQTAIQELGQAFHARDTRVALSTAIKTNQDE